MINYVKHSLEAPDGTDAPTAQHIIDIYVDGQSVQIVLPIQSTPEEVSALLVAGAETL
jgi:hypothetical protein